MVRRPTEVDGLLGIEPDSGKVQNAAPSFKAISAVTEVRPLMMRLMTLRSQPR